MGRLVLISAGERVAGKKVRPDMSIRTIDNNRLVATDPQIVKAVSDTSIALGAVEQKLADHIPYVEQREALWDLDAHGLVSREKQSHAPSKLKKFSSGVMNLLK